MYTVFANLKEKVFVVRLKQENLQILGPGGCCVHNMDRLKLIKNYFFKYYNIKYCYLEI